MGRLIRILSTYAVPILGAALVAAVVAWGIQTWRIGSLQSENGRLAAQINSVVRANRTNMQTIEELERANEQSARMYAEVLEKQRLSVDQIQQLEDKLSQRAGDDIAQIESTTDKCARQPLPDDIRDRLRNGGDRDANSKGSSRAPGPG